MKRFIINYFPFWAQNILISIFNTYQYKLRHSGDYTYQRKRLEKFDKYSIDEVEKESKLLLQDFLKRACEDSAWYSKYNYRNGLSSFPILEKKNLVESFSEIAALDAEDGVVSLTGGTTGASMKVVFTKSDDQLKHAFIDFFRSKFGYQLGEKVAWFSGKSIVTLKDISKGVCYRDDWINKIRFFSTFHINEENFYVYWKAFCDYSPKYIVGFPSSVFEICKMAKSYGLSFTGSVQVFFPTAETLLAIHKEVIFEVLGCRIINQYSSSEGAPFILECLEGNMHIHPLSGVIEVVDENMLPSADGEMLVTSFFTNGTPLIRYRIGDRLTLADTSLKCGCGSDFQMVESIDGRSSDCLLSPENGRVNLGNISNCTKEVEGIICFQVVQYELEKIIVNIVATKLFDVVQENKLRLAFKERMGGSVKVEIKLVEDIPKEKSGKFRIVKNSLI